MYTPKTGAPCTCKRGAERDNCARCEGTGQEIDFRAIREARGFHVGDVLVYRGDPRGNPFGSICGPERKEALSAFKNGRPVDGLTFWYFRPGGGEFRTIKPAEVNWSSSGVD